MKPIYTLIVLAITSTAALPVLAAPGGRLGTLPLGEYRCALPGDATGPAWRPLEGKDKSFRIVNASTYRTADDGYGTYLLTGENVTFTRGPLNGLRFVRKGSSTLRRINEGGEPGDVRCVRVPGSS